MLGGFCGFCSFCSDLRAPGRSLGQGAVTELVGRALQFHQPDIFEMSDIFDGIRYTAGHGRFADEPLALALDLLVE